MWGPFGFFCFDEMLSKSLCKIYIFRKILFILLKVHNLASKSRTFFIYLNIKKKLLLKTFVRFWYENVPIRNTHYSEFFVIPFWNALIFLISIKFNADWTMTVHQYVCMSAEFLILRMCYVSSRFDIAPI